MQKRRLCLQLIDLAIIVTVTAVTAVMLPNVDSVRMISENIGFKIAVLAICLSVVRNVLHLYSCVWRYANVKVYLRLLIADVIGGLLFIVLGRIVSAFDTGFTYSIISVLLITMATLISRFFYQILYTEFNLRKEQPTDRHNKINIAIIGAGNVGATLADELIRNPKSQYNPYCFVDCDVSKVGKFIRNIRIYEENEHTIDLLKSFPIQEIVIAIPDISTQEKVRLYEFYGEIGCRVKIYDYLQTNGEVSNKRTLRDFSIEDLLFRDVISLSDSETAAFYNNKTILVTGGGGSIGGELCMQIAELNPKRLILLDIYENNAYEIQQVLHTKYGVDFPLEVIIASVRDREEIYRIFDRYRPEIVFHAAAHKHVPLMENSPAEAIKNNVFGTHNVADAAEEYGVEKFILISSDKAVNPTNIMGASKRMCEMDIQSRTDSKTEFMAVRFGNVLGSHGSVVPQFRRQIAAGGPVTITDKRIIRYFMTIPEAVSLVMETGVMAKGGELFVLNMGEPVKIIELAEKMIQLSGFVPYEDIDIVEIGLRPGEKLYEELLMQSEELDATENDMIFVERESVHTRDEISGKLELLRSVLSAEDAQIFDAFRQVVPTFHTPNEVNEKVHECKDCYDAAKVQCTDDSKKSFASLGI